MKAFTDIEQSKKLSEFLPIESADMYYTVCPNAEDNSHDGYDDVRLRIEKPFGDEFKKWYSCYTEIDWYDSPYIPCWSLASLLEIIPNQLDEFQFLLFPCYNSEEWGCCYENENSDDFNVKIKYITYGGKPVDTCYEMILILKEEKIL